jgi:hypothetical protein
MRRGVFQNAGQVSSAGKARFRFVIEAINYLKIKTEGALLRETF